MKNYLKKLFRVRGYYTKNKLFNMAFHKEFTGKAKKPLVNYDLYHAKEEKTGNKKVLIAYTYYSVYLTQVVENISKRYSDIEFSILTKDPVYKDKITADSLKHIYCFESLPELYDILLQLPVYDAMQFLWIEYEWSYFYRLIRAKTRRLNLNVGGSDFYRATTNDRQYYRRLIACADNVTAETGGTIQEFGDYYKKYLKKPLGLLPFGVEVLDWIKNAENASREDIRTRFGIPENRLIVTCGHNAGMVHQHMKIIDALIKLPQDIKDKCVFVFPMTYGNNKKEYTENVIGRLQAEGLCNVVLTEFMDFQAMAEYALISDVMIHVQKTDQLSSTMLEEMYAGSIVVAGEWLPYKSLHEMGIYFIDVKDISEIMGVLTSIVYNIDEYKARCISNKDIVWQHSSWDGLASKWHSLWE